MTCTEKNLRKLCQNEYFQPKHQLSSSTLACELSFVGPLLDLIVGHKHTRRSRMSWSASSGMGLCASLVCSLFSSGVSCGWVLLGAVGCCRHGCRVLAGPVGCCRACRVCRAVGAVGVCRGSVSPTKILRLQVQLRAQTIQRRGASLRSAPFGSARLRSAPLGSARLRSAPLGSTRLRSAPLGSVGSVGSVGSARP